MAKIGPNTLLQRVPRLRLQLESDNSARILLDDRALTCGPHALAVLNAFSQPTSMSAALSKLAPATGGAQDWVELTRTIVDLHAAGVLLDEESHAAPLREDATGFDGAAVHSVMLDDRERTSRFLEGIQEVVRAGDVVVDVGSGTGILAMAAARAGASRVYAIEASRIGKSAKLLFQENGFADRIVLVEGWSSQVTLPERADVLVSEIVGNDPFGEHVLEVTADAVKRLLKPKARLVPRRVRLFGLPVTVPAPEMAKHVFTSGALRRWGSWYGFDFAPLAKISRDSLRLLYVNPYRARGWPALSEPILIASLDLASRRDAEVQSVRSAPLTRPGRVDGVLLFFELDLGPTTTLSTHPAKVTRQNHWRSPVWTMAHPVEAVAGNRITLRYSYGSEGSRLEYRVR
jgi:hypothetical protein